MTALLHAKGFCCLSYMRFKGGMHCQRDVMADELSTLIMCICRGLCRMRMHFC